MVLTCDGNNTLAHFATIAGKQNNDDDITIFIPGNDYNYGGSDDIHSESKNTNSKFLIVSETDPSVNIDLEPLTESFNTKKILKYLENENGTKSIRWVTENTDINIKSNVFDGDDFSVTNNVTTSGYFFDREGENKITSGNVGAARISENRNIYTQIRDGNGKERGVTVTNDNELKIKGLIQGTHNSTPTNISVNKSGQLEVSIVEDKSYNESAATSNNQEKTLDKLDVINTSLGNINTSLGNIYINVDNLEVNTDGLEGLTKNTNTILGNIDLVLDVIKSSVQNLDNTVNDNKIQVNVVKTILPSGAATSVSQNSMITSLGNVERSLNTIKENTTSLDNKIIACNTGAVVISSGSITELHSSAINTTLNTLNGKIPSKGQNNMDNSIPVVLPSDQSKINVSIVEGNITGYSTSYKQDTIITSLGNINTAVEKIDNSTYVNNTTWNSSSSHNLIGGIYQEIPDTISENKATPIRLSNKGAVHISDGGNAILIAGKNGSTTKTFQTDENGNLKVAIISDSTSSGGSGGSGGSATSTNQATMITSLGNVEVSLNTIKANTTSLDNKITLCNTGDVTISSGSINELHSSAINTSLNTIKANTTSLDSKITLCNTGDVTISSGSITELHSSGINTSLNTIKANTNSIDNKITYGSNSTLTNATQVLAYGRDQSGALHPMDIDSNGHLKIVLEEIDSNVSLPEGTNNIGKVNIMGNDGITIRQISTDSSGKINIINNNLTSIGNTVYSTGESVIGGDGILIFAKDTNNAKPLEMDSSGRLYVNVAQSSNLNIQGSTANGLTASDNPLLVAGTYDNKVNLLQSDSSGNLKVAIVSDSTSSGGGGGTEFATDTTYSSGDNGKLLLGVKQSSHSSLGNDGNYVPLSITDDGELRVTTSSSNGTSSYTKNTYNISFSNNTIPVNDYVVSNSLTLNNRNSDRIRVTVNGNNDNITTSGNIYLSNDNTVWWEVKSDEGTSIGFNNGITNFSSSSPMPNTYTLVSDEFLPTGKYLKLVLRGGSGMDNYVISSAKLSY